MIAYGTLGAGYHYCKCCGGGHSAAHRARREVRNEIEEQLAPLSPFDVWSLEDGTVAGDNTFTREDCPRCSCDCWDSVEHGCIARECLCGAVVMRLLRAPPVKLGEVIRGRRAA